MHGVKLNRITVAAFALPLDVVSAVAQTSFDSERIVSLVATDIFVIIMEPYVYEFRETSNSELVFKDLV